jgi:hypothetical protein
MAKKRSSGDKSSAAPPSSQKRSALMSASPLSANSRKVPRKVVSPHQDIKQYETDGSVADPEAAKAMTAAEVPRSQKLGWLAKLRLAFARAVSSANVIPPMGHSTVLVQTMSTSDSVEDAIDAIARKLSALPRDKLLAGLSVLVRDLDAIKGELQPREAAFFAETFEPIIVEERRDHPGNTIFTTENSNLPSGMASAYAKSKRDPHSTSQRRANAIEEVQRC